MGEWIKFEPVEVGDGRKTRVWFVLTIDGTEKLGQIAWYSPWRRYCFQPQLGTIYEQDCMRRIADFCERETKIHKGVIHADRTEHRAL